MSVAGKARKVTTNTLQEMKRAGEQITMLTAYDYSLARLVDQGGVDVILVGDSASNVMAGNDTTVPITLELKEPMPSLKQSKPMHHCKHWD